jgi:collagenase-like PrtC family protease
MKKPELLAPAGDLTRMKYAYAYGADAVYAGQPAFSLRARENGFKNLDDLAEGIAYTLDDARHPSLSAAAATKARTAWNEDTVARRYIELYERLLT